MLGDESGVAQADGRTDALPPGLAGDLGQAVMLSGSEMMINGEMFEKPGEDFADMTQGDAIVGGMAV